MSAVLTVDAAALLAELRAAGAIVQLDDGQLRVKAAAGVLTPSRKEAIRQQKEALLEILAVEEDEPAALDPDRPLAIGDRVSGQTSSVVSLLEGKVGRIIDIASASGGGPDWADLRHLNGDRVGWIPIEQLVREVV